MDAFIRSPGVVEALGITQISHL